MAVTRLRLFYRWAFGITWGVGGLALVVGAWGQRALLQPGTVWYYLAGYGPSLAGLLCAWQWGGAAEVGTLVRRVMPRRAHGRAYLEGLLLLVLIAVLAALGSPGVRVAEWPRTSAEVLAWVHRHLLVDTGPLGEELGWRGVALPLLLRTRSPGRAAVDLGLVWILWHVPTFLIPGMPQQQLAIVAFSLATLGLSVIMTTLYVRTDGDLALMIGLHLGANVLAGSLGLAEWPRTVAIVGVAGVLLGVQRRSQRRIAV